MVGTAYLRILSRRASLIIRISARPRGRQAAGRGGLRKRRSKRLTVPLGMTALGMATGVGVEWVRASKAAAGAGKPPEELEAGSWEPRGAAGGSRWRRSPRGRRDPPPRTRGSRHSLADWTQRSRAGSLADP